MKPAITSKLLSECHGLVHGFGTQGEPFPLKLKSVWDLKKPQWKQVHGCGVAQIRSGEGNEHSADALWTQDVSQPIAVVSADCVPVLLARRDGSCVAAVHAGWRGTRARILKVLWEELKAKGETPADWVGAVGPAIGPCCYQVSVELAQDFKNEFMSYGQDLAVPRERILDLPAINHAQLMDLGVSAVDLIRACTMCSKSGEDYDFNSYRRLGSGVRQYSAIMIAGSNV